MSSVRDSGLGSMHVLSDKLVVRVLTFLTDVRDMLSLALVSKSLYVFSHHDALWRELCFRRHAGDFAWKGNWRLTALLPARKVVDPATVPRELYCTGFASAWMYERWCRNAVDKRLFNITFSHIEKVRNLSYEDFVAKYLSLGKPVVICDAIDHWPCRHWTPDEMAEKFGEKRFRTNWHRWNEEKKKYRNVYMTLKDFWSYGRHNQDSEPGYIFDGSFWKEKNIPELLKAYDRTQYFREDFFSVLGDDNRPPFRWFLCGPVGSGSPWHTDPHCTSAWNALLYGRKRWALYPPTMTPPGVAVSKDGRYSSMKPFRWFMEVYPHLEDHERPIELIQEPGELIFVPTGWWHTVLNVTETIAVTQNWIDRFNFNVAWTEIKRTEPEKLAAEFGSRLIYVRPELFETYEKVMNDLEKDGKLPPNIVEMRKKEREAKEKEAEERAKERAKEKKQEGAKQEGGQ